jgi:transposase
VVKSYGERLPKCGTQQISREFGAELSAQLREVLEPLFREIESLNEQIKEYDRRIEKMAKETYPETELLKQVKGVGDLIALTYVLTIEDPYRFPKSREVGCFLGLRPGRRNSGERRTTDAYQKTRGRVSTTLGRDAQRARRKKRRETSSDCGSAKTSNTAASVMGERSGLRTTAQ